MTALEKISGPPTRVSGTALYDWDYLVQEDRAHRLIYTDPAIFDEEMRVIWHDGWVYVGEGKQQLDDGVLGRGLFLRI